MTGTTGLDTAAAPTPSVAKAALAAVQGTFWCVYIGGTRNGGSGWTPALIAQYAAAGITEYLPIWVGNQIIPAMNLHDALDASYGYAHGKTAVADMQRFGWRAGCPVALDVEYETAQADPTGAVAYVDGWNVAVREGGYVPGTYAPLFFLQRLWGEANRPDFAFPADWIRTAPDHTLDPGHIPGLPHEVFKGMRVWQYAGGAQTYVNGLSVDIDTADFPLAPPPGVDPQPPAITPPAPAYIVTTAHYLRTEPAVLATHGPLLTVGERLIMLGEYTTHWGLCEVGPQGPRGWCFRQNCRVAE